MPPSQDIDLLAQLNEMRQMLKAQQVPPAPIVPPAEPPAHGIFPVEPAVAKNPPAPKAPIRLVAQPELYVPVPRNLEELYEKF
ncbi:hypothetical protein TIFTF001_015409 [Ficus carica]|uniref:Uncharacterized protein n=1 Tax=Ficus carica TaxID=3494 RepID=A0AA88DIM7_FICCA|nr:hypothetical protein TIFTF001_015409 [Ficus carica]